MFTTHHIGINVHDLEATLSFYKRLLDATLVERMALNGEELAFIRIGNTLIELVDSGQDKEEVSSASSIHLAFQTNNLTDAIVRFQGQQIKLEEGPYHLENGWKAVYFRGINNELIELIECPSTKDYA
ncbi:MULTISPECIES: VOC family protein [Bacillaceae]|uniref:VOC domain-containing protein n=1 Tax=Alkalicoccobacillus plakortidis TaxID=444060 RepID=A0A9D5I0L5_9BACI|nr:MULTISPECIES: VOC family protein [Bacillaceae]KQL56741.1 hypothetical protein AN965_12110 [Alkalicoccobacillus plakortidis]